MSEELIGKWKQLGFDLYSSLSLYILNNNDKEIIVDKRNKNYCCLKTNVYYDESPILDIEMNEHQLLTKTFKELGWL